MPTGRMATVRRTYVPVWVDSICGTDLVVGIRFAVFTPRRTSDIIRDFYARTSSYTKPPPMDSICLAWLAFLAALPGCLACLPCLSALPCLHAWLACLRGCLACLAALPALLACPACVPPLLLTAISIIYMLNYIFKQ